MKPTDEQIRAEAVRYANSPENIDPYCNNLSEGGKLKVIEWCAKFHETGAKWALFQDSTIEKVKSLKHGYEIALKDCMKSIKKGGNCIQLTELGTKSRECRQFIGELNSIIEAK